jgi:hypothetical protein
MPRFSQFGLGLLVASLAFNAGCGACSQKKKKKKKKAQASSETAPAKVEPKVHADIIPTPAAVAIQVAGRAYLWTDGRTAMMSMNTEAASWSDDGFAYANLGGAQVLAPGGSFYWRFGEAKAPQTPMAEVFKQTTTPPAGFEVKVESGRGDKVQVSILGPEGRKVRVGLFNEVPSAVVWLQGKLPEGTTASKALDKTAGWKMEGDGVTPKMELPDGATAVAAAPVPPETLTIWGADLNKLRSGEAKVVTSSLYNLDGDPYIEGFVCASGGKGDYSCFVVDEINGERRYYATNIPYDDPAKGAAPIAFTKDGGTYLMWVGRTPRANDTMPKLLQVLRYGPSGYTVEVLH